MAAPVPVIPKQPEGVQHQQQSAGRIPNTDQGFTKLFRQVLRNLVPVTWTDFLNFLQRIHQKTDRLAALQANNL